MYAKSIMQVELNYIYMYVYCDEVTHMYILYI